jgi:ribosomal protein S6--L-glutamate ligase
MVGHSIEDSGLRAKDIVVLPLHRGTTDMPNPKGSRVLQDGDRMLCFGKLESMRDLVPARRKTGLKKVEPLDTEIEPTHGAAWDVSGHTGGVGAGPEEVSATE